MENIEKQLADFKAEQDKRFEEFKSSLVKPQFEVGKWYIANCNSNKDYLIRLSKICKDGGFTANCFFTAGGSFAEYSGKFDSITRPATLSEVESALVKEFEKREMNEADIKLKLLDGSVNTWAYPCKDYKYDLLTDSLFVHTWRVYKQGKWATIIKDEAIKIGGYEVTKEKDSFGVYYKIGCKSIRYDALLTISQVMGLNGFKKIKLDEHETTLETINAILEKLK